MGDLQKDDGARFADEQSVNGDRWLPGWCACMLKQYGGVSDENLEMRDKKRKSNATRAVMDHLSDGANHVVALLLTGKDVRMARVVARRGQLESLRPKRLVGESSAVVVNVHHRTMALACGQYRYVITWCCSGEIDGFEGGSVESNASGDGPDSMGRTDSMGTSLVRQELRDVNSMAVV